MSKHTLPFPAVAPSLSPFSPALSKGRLSVGLYLQSCLNLAEWKSHSGCKARWGSQGVKRQSGEGNCLHTDECTGHSDTSDWQPIERLFWIAQYISISQNALRWGNWIFFPMEAPPLIEIYNFRCWWVYLLNLNTWLSKHMDSCSLLLIFRKPFCDVCTHCSY